MKKGNVYKNNRPESVAQRKVQTRANDYASQPIQKLENNTGLPDNLKSGIENLSGHSMNDVKAHYNSNKPAQLQAHAYAQGTDIHLGSGQEKHLPHEAWHVVQQKQGRVRPTMQMKGMVNINDAGLEKEVDVMGARALLFWARTSGIQRVAATTKGDELDSDRERITTNSKIPIQQIKEANKDFEPNKYVGKTVFQLQEDGLDTEKLQRYIFMKINEIIKDKTGVTEGLSLDEAINIINVEMLRLIDATTEEEFEKVYKKGKLPTTQEERAADVRGKYNNYFLAEKFKTTIKKLVVSGRRDIEYIRTAELAQEGAMTKISVKTSSGINEKDLDWDVIWSKLGSLGYYPTHIKLPKNGSFYEHQDHFRAAKDPGTNNHVFMIDKGVLHIKEVVEHHLDATTIGKKKYKAATPTSYNSYEFFVSADKRATVTDKFKKQPKTLEKDDGAWGATEAQSIVMSLLDVEHRDVDPDGFCLISSTALGLGMSIDQLRNNVFERLLINEDGDNYDNGELTTRIASIFGSTNEFVNDLYDRSAWAGARGNDIISGLALILNVNIHVINENGTISQVNVPGAEDVIYVSRLIRDDVAHYNGVVKK